MLCKPNGIRVSARKRAGHAAEWAQEQNQRMLTVLLWVAPGRRRDKGSNQYVFSNISELLASVHRTQTHSQTNSPLHKYSGLDGVHDAAEAGFLLVASQHQAHLAGEGGGQPVPHFRRHRLRLDVAQLVLRVHQTPDRQQDRVELAFDHTHHSFCISTSSLQLLLHILLLTWTTATTCSMTMASVILNLLLVEGRQSVCFSKQTDIS